MRFFGAQALDGDDFLVFGNRVERDCAGAHRHAVDMHRARPALRDAAAIFGARQADMLADDPQERHVVLDVDLNDFAVDVELRHSDFPGDEELRLVGCRRQPLEV
jgi:hypothetical protein